jgi:hypothetical protein
MEVNYMLTILFAILMLAVFGKLLIFSIKAAWGITKIVFAVVCVPLVLIGLFCAGLVYVAIGIVIVAGLVGFVKELL